MHKETITYVDFNDVTRTEEFYFNLSKANVLEMDAKYPGGYVAMIERITSAENGEAIMDIFKTFILDSIGEKSADGKQFIKNQQIKDNFYQSNAYSELLLKLATDDRAANTFIQATLPKKTAAQDGHQPTLRQA